MTGFLKRRGDTTVECVQLDAPFIDSVCRVSAKPSLKNMKITYSTIERRFFFINLSVSLRSIGQTIRPKQ